MLEAVIVVIISVLFGTLGYFLYLLLKNDNTHRNQILIVDAIARYQLHCIRNGNYEEVDNVRFEDMEEYSDTFNRFWDWGYKRILPKEKFEIIKPFIKR